ncbi:hypothetical protein [Dyadobacter sp. CY343]|uniref:hypothetical protein n=1 Tax=Dyadobacter sp. CY343 TaxID=2907299 RepID=UPI001F177938|nr:hypothetical protein [Dyadobacter sp. CY343]MCE7060179.1 hypothetical protein [Dyadobacter sp. CY343]
MKRQFYLNKILPFFTAFLLIFVCFSASGQCKEKISESNDQKVHYHEIPLKGKSEYLTLSRTGEERLFSYHNTDLDLVFHARMFTEIRFISNTGNFSLFTTSSDRSRWFTAFTLTSPLTPKEILKMRGTEKIEIILPEEKRIFIVSASSNNLIRKALGCLK